MNKADYLENQLGLFDNYESLLGGDDSSYGRTYQVHLQADQSVELILEPCLKASQKPVFQCLKMEDGQTPEWFNAQSAKLRGECLMLNIGEYPNEERESFLSQILQSPTDVPQKYYLSARACQGILNRAEKRGKELPAPLKKALEQQAKLSTGGGTFDVRISSDGTHNFRAHCYETDICRSLDTHAPDPNTNHGGVAILEKVYDCRNGKQIDKSQTLNTDCRQVCGKQNAQVVVSSNDTPLVLNDQGGSVMNVSKNVCGTLRAESHGNVPCIMDMTHANDVIRESKGLSPTLNARMGTGENQVPLVFALEGNGARESHHDPGFTDSDKMYTLNTVEHHAVAYCMGHDERSAQFEKNKTDPLTASDYKQPPVVAQPVSTTGGQVYAIGNGQLDQLKMSAKVGALNCMHDQIAVMQELVTESKQSEACAPMTDEDSTGKM